MGCILRAIYIVHETPIHNLYHPISESEETLSIITSRIVIKSLFASAI